MVERGSMQNIIALIGSLGGGTVTSATSPLAINSGVLSLSLSAFCTAATSPLILTNGQMSIDLTSYIPTSHEASNVGAANVAFGAFDLNTRTVTLQNSAGVTAVLSVSNGGYVSVGADSLVSVSSLNNWQHLSLKLKDSH